MQTESERVNRRTFLGAAALTGAALVSPAARTATAPPRRRMTIDLRCGSIGVRADMPEAVALAHRHGFESVEPQARYLAGLSDADLVKFVDDLRGKGLALSAAGLPVNFRADEKRLQRDLERLSGYAKALRRAGVTRISTWISPAHPRLTYLQNFRLHAERLRRVARVLGERGCRLGLEYVGPRTAWSSALHPFIHTLAETRELIAEIGLPGVGVVLDSWHWYHAREKADDILALRNEQVIAVDLNDAPKGVPIDEQVDNRRELPAATGVIDIKAFLGALVRIGYDGPVRAEPFNAALNRMPAEEAVATTAAAMRRAFALIGG